jgi:hypothetical protein
MECRLQVANLDHQIFASYPENPSFAPGDQAPMRHLEILLYQRQFPTSDR